MAQITDYATLTAALSNWDARTWSSADTDEAIGLAEAEIRLYLGPNYAKETTVTLNTDASGEASLPSGFIRVLSLTHSTFGPLQQVAREALDQYNVLGLSGVPAYYAITGSIIKTAPIYDGNLTLTFDGKLTGLSGSNTTNWLITNAPQAYLSLCMYFLKAKMEDPLAQAYRAQGMQTLADLNLQALVGQYGRTALTIKGPTP